MNSSIVPKLIDTRGTGTPVEVNSETFSTQDHHTLQTTIQEWSVPQTGKVFQGAGITDDGRVEVIVPRGLPSYRANKLKCEMHHSARSAAVRHRLRMALLNKTAVKTD